MITVVIPAKDEEDGIIGTVQQVRSALKELPHEIIVVDDGSGDATRERALSAGARVVVHPHNLGYGASLKSGIRTAKFDTIVITDADGTYPNELILDLLKVYEKGFDMVVGARQGENYLGSWLKAPMRAILKFLVEYTTGRKVPDVNSGFRIFSKSRVLDRFDLYCDTFSFTTSLTLYYSMNALFVGYVPIPYHKRVGKTKVRLLQDSLLTLQYIIEAVTYYNPLKFFVLISFFLLVAASGSILLNTYLKISALYIISLGLILMAVQIFCIGLIAILLKQIMAKK